MRNIGIEEIDVGKTDMVQKVPPPRGFQAWDDQLEILQILQMPETISESSNMHEVLLQDYVKGVDNVGHIPAGPKHPDKVLNVLLRLKEDH